jgi:hypothetical protein
MEKTMFVIHAMALLLVATPAQKLATREYLTPDEITKIQDAQEIDLRIKIYLQAGALRLKAAEERLNGKESAPGEPLEFYSVEEMLDGYYQIVRSVMINLDDAYQKPSQDRAMVQKALKNLKESTKKAIEDLEILKKIAEEKRLEEAWNLINQALDIAKGAYEGAELGLSRQPSGASKPKARKPS